MIICIDVYYMIYVYNQRERGTIVMAKRNYESIDEYIALCPEDIQGKLQELRKMILGVDPNLIEKISWQMPTFYFNNKKNIIHFAAHKNHIGLYPGVEAIERYADRLKGYKTSKGAIQIPKDKDFDTELITDIVKFNIGLVNNAI